MKKYFFDNIEKYGEKTALLQENGKVYTYQDIAIGMQKFSSMLTARSLVFVLCTNSVGCIMGYLAFLRNRVVPVMLDADIDEGLLYTLLEIYKPQYIYQPDESGDCYKGAYSRIYAENGYSLFCNKVDLQYPLYEELALLLTTSGSTGSPKFVRQSYENIQVNAESICEYLEINDTERAITSLPMNYTYGLSIIHTHLLKGASIVVTKLPVIRKEFWTLVSEKKVTSLAGVPYTYEVLEKMRFMDMQIPELKTLTQAGGKLPVNLHMKFAQYAERTKKKFVVMYGQAEATARMSWLPYEKSIEKCGSIGIPIPGGQFSILGIDGEEIMKAEEEGELVYRGKNVTLGYAESADDLIKPNEFNNILYTGDIAKKDVDDYYYITGRKKRFLKLYGSRVSLDEIDQLVKKEYPQADCASVGSDRKMIIYTTSKDKLAEMRKFVVDTTHINAAAVETRYISEIPRNSSGKILYNQLQEE